MSRGWLYPGGMSRGYPYHMTYLMIHVMSPPRTDTHLSNHYLPGTTVAGGNNYFNIKYEEKNINGPRRLKIIIWPQC